MMPDVAHDSRIQRRVVALSALSLLSACVRLRQLREVHHKIAASPESLIAHGRRAHHTDGRHTDGSPAHLLCYACASCSRYPLNPPCVRSLGCCGNSERCLCPVWGAIGPCRGVLPWTNARCVVGQWNRDKNYRNFRSNPTSDTKHFCLFFSNIYRNLTLGRIFEKVNF